MAELIDVLMPKVSLCPTFTVDTTGPDYVDIAAPAVAIMDLFSADVTRYNFDQGDNFTILSFGYFVPENFATFEMAGPNYAVPSWKMYLYRNVSLTSAPIVQFGVNGSIQSPFPNYEMAMGIFLDVNTIVQENFHLQVSNTTRGRISMIGVPAVLNTKVFHVVPFVKILHNFALKV